MISKILDSLSASVLFHLLTSGFMQLESGFMQLTATGRRRTLQHYLLYFKILLEHKNVDNHIQFFNCGSRGYTCIEGYTLETRLTATLTCRY